MTRCIFCDIVEGKAEASMVFQDDLISAFMDIQPVNPGHVLIIPNRHAAFLAELPEEAGERIFRTAQRLANALRMSGLRCEGVNLFLADGEAAMQEVFHVHLHLIPRYHGDGFGLQLPEHYFTKPPRFEISAAAEKIKRRLAEVRNA